MSAPGTTMTRLHAPPGVTSIDTRSSGTSASPPYQAAKSSGTVQASKTRSRGAATTRVMSMPSRAGCVMVPAPSGGLCPGEHAPGRAASRSGAGTPPSDRRGKHHRLLRVERHAHDGPLLRGVPQTALRLQGRTVAGPQGDGHVVAAEGAYAHRAAQAVLRAADPHPARPHQHLARALRRALGHRHLAPG